MTISLIGFLLNPAHYQKIALDLQLPELRSYIGLIRPF
jgi:hypothetical protein